MCKVYEGNNKSKQSIMETLPGRDQARKPFGTSYKFMRGVVNYRLKLTGLQLTEGSKTTDIDVTYQALINYRFTTDHPEDETPWQRHVRQEVNSGKNDKLFNEAQVQVEEEQGSRIRWATD